MRLKRRRRPKISGKRMMPESVKHRLQRLILPIIATGTKDSSFEPIGSGFIIRSLGRQALMLSAAHNFSHIAHKIDRPYELHHPSVPDILRPHQSKIELAQTKMQVIYRHSDGTNYFAQILKVITKTPGDLAACIIYFDERVPPEVIFDSQLAIDTAPPDSGTPIIATGYAGMVATPEIDREINTRVRYSHQLQWRPGAITTLFRSHGPIGQAWPCFQCNVAFDNGMSGGPVLKRCGNDEYVACGIICSDLSISNVMSEGAGHGLASTLWPAMGIAIPASVDGQPERPVLLLELERLRYIDDRGRASEHVSIIPGETDDAFTIVWQ